MYKVGYDMAWYGIALYDMVQHGMTWYIMAWYGIAWHDMVYYGMVWQLWQLLSEIKLNQLLIS